MPHNTTHRKANPLAVNLPESSVGKNAGKYCNRTGVHI